VYIVEQSKKPHDNHPNVPDNIKVGHLYRVIVPAPAVNMYWAEGLLSKSIDVPRGNVLMLTDVIKNYTFIDFVFLVGKHQMTFSIHESNLQYFKDWFEEME